MHHLQLHLPSTRSAAAWRRVIGQCSAGDRALSRVGHPHPSMTGSRSTCRRNGVPQWLTPRLITRSGHRSQISARVAQSALVDNAPVRLSRAAAALAMAQEIDRNALDVQVAQGMTILSDDSVRSLQVGIGLDGRHFCRRGLTVAKGGIAYRVPTRTDF